MDSTISLSLAQSLNEFSLWITIYSIVVSVIGAIKLTQRQILLWNTRDLRKIWGIKDKDKVIVICSELDEPVARQNVELREFIYNLKYGDVDAYFEVIATLLRLYPKLKLRILSAGEAETTTFDMAQHIILIGGPDYNEIAGKYINTEYTQIDYLSRTPENKSKLNETEIVIRNKSSGQEFFDDDEMRDYGYFERINNPHNPQAHIILVGGCHTIGVTAAVKSFSLSKSEYGEIPQVVIDNSKRVAKKINKKSEFAIIVKAQRVGQTINTPIVNDSLVFIKRS